MKLFGTFKSRVNYWSCSDFADWIRGTDKPSSETSEGWQNWSKLAKANSRVRYWIAEKGLDILQDILYFPTDVIYGIKYYVNNRWVTKTHSLTASKTHIPRGEWRDVGNRFLPCMFNELVDFVEIETAWSHIAWGDKETRTKYKAPFWATGWFRWRTWRCPQAGLDHLDWAMTLTNSEWYEPDHPEYGKPTYQAKAAKEIKELYVWWTTVYPNRPDPHDASGWTEYCDRKRQEHGETGLSFMKESKNPELRSLGDAALKKTHEIEQAYEEEDTQMLCRLIKIRDSLWT